jgi:hypothetical protein
MGLIESLRKLLLDPGLRFAGYVLRIACVMLAGAYLISSLIYAAPPQQIEVAADLVRS